ncbi:unnamed protein product [Leptosia nina]|uniref:Uncharacterized protein n=1 Tax=Leptosia nina TaxID=320188 RepID=A0AAV1JJX5_9NEOP
MNKLAQRRNFFERGVNTVRWARLRHRHSSVSFVLYFLSPTVLRLAHTRNKSRLDSQENERSPTRTNVAHQAARSTEAQQSAAPLDPVARRRRSNRTWRIELSGNAARNNSERNGRDTKCHDRRFTTKYYQQIYTMLIKVFMSQKSGITKEKKQFTCHNYTGGHSDQTVIIIAVQRNLMLVASVIHRAGFHQSGARHGRAGHMPLATSEIDRQTATRTPTYIA